MTKNKWTRFFWKDWEADERLRCCSLAAQGLWMRMLCLMSKAEPAGYLRIGADPCTVETLARYVGESKETVSALVEELGRKGVYSITRTGVIYNRRMVADEKLRRKRSEAGKVGADATNRKIKRKSEVPRQKSGNGVGKHAGPTITTITTNPPKAPPGHGGARPPAGFDRFWEIYPKRVRRKEAERSFRSAIKRVDVGTICAAATRFAESCRAKRTAPQFIAAASVWLNNDRWEDWADETGGDLPIDDPVMAIADEVLANKGSER